MPTEFDESSFPLVRMRVFGSSSDEDVSERIAFATRLVARNEPFAFVFDTRESRGISATQRRAWSAWLREHDASIRRTLVGCAIVAPSAVGRAIFTGVFWIWPPPMPVAFFENAEEAERWAREQLASREATAP